MFNISENRFSGVLRAFLLLPAAALLVLSQPVMAAEEVSADVSTVTEVTASAAETAVISQDEAPVKSGGIASADADLSQDQAVSEDKTERFAVTAAPMPKLYAVSLNRLREVSSAAKSDEAENRVKEMLAAEKGRDAAKVLGEAIGAAVNSSYFQLGRFCADVIYQSQDLDQAVNFITDFVKGYGKNGVVILTRDGVESFQIYGARRGDMWKIVPDGKIAPDKYERIFSAPRAWVIAFPKGEVFKIDLLGRAGGTARAWKILPEGMNSKSWSGGNWEREITVRGDKIY